MMELPISKDIKEYYKERNMEFTDSERATLIWNSLLPSNEILDALKEIFDTTDDVVLREQIEKRLMTEWEKKRAFMSRDSDYVHSVIVDDSTEADGVFISVDEAILYGKENCDETFKIIKNILEEKIEPKMEGKILLSGEAEFKKDGTMVDCVCRTSKEVGFVFLNELEPTGFEEAYISVLNPFEYGDIVHIMGSSLAAIVVSGKDEWEERKERWKRNNRPQNYYCNTLTVECICPDGEFDHMHPDIFTLEKITQWEDEKEWKLLQAISELMKGNGWIEEVFSSYRDNKWDKR